MVLLLGERGANLNVSVSKYCSQYFDNINSNIDSGGMFEYFPEIFINNYYV